MMTTNYSPTRRSVFVLAALALLPLAGCSHAKVVVPTAYTTYMATDKNFICEGPKGWASSSYASGATDSGFTFTSADASIKVDANSSGSLMGDITNGAGIGGGGMGSETPTSAPVPAVERVHAMQQQNFQGRLHNYSELATQHTTATYGDGRVTEYQADGIHGYRATILGHDRSVDIDCNCSEAEWPSLKDSFMHVINSVKTGPNN